MTHLTERHCTHDQCAAVVYGGLPPEWHADDDSGDVLCPQHAAQAVWFRIVSDRDIEAQRFKGLDAYDSDAERTLTGRVEPTAQRERTSERQHVQRIDDDPTAPMRVRRNR